MEEPRKGKALVVDDGRSGEITNFYDVSDEVKEAAKKRIRTFSGLSRKQLGLFLTGAFSFVVSFAWNTFAQTLLNTLIPANLKNSATVRLIAQLLYAFIVTFTGCVLIAFLNLRRKEENPELKQILRCCESLTSSEKRKPQL
jgi:hypothetical protein